MSKAERPAELRPFAPDRARALVQAFTIRQLIGQTPRLKDTRPDMVSRFPNLMQTARVVRAHARSDSLERMFLLYSDKKPGRPEQGKTYTGIARIVLEQTIQDPHESKRIFHGNVLDYWIAGPYTIDERPHTAAVGGLLTMNHRLNVATQARSEYVMAVVPWDEQASQDRASELGNEFGPMTGSAAPLQTVDGMIRTALRGPGSLLYSMGSRQLG